MKNLLNIILYLFDEFNNKTHKYFNLILSKAICKSIDNKTYKYTKVENICKVCHGNLSNSKQPIQPKFSLYSGFDFGPEFKFQNV